MASKYFYRFKANGEPMLCERPDTTPEREVVGTNPKTGEKIFRESRAAASAPKETPKEPDKGAVRTNATEGKNNGVYLNPDLLRRYALTEYGKDVSLFDLIHDPRHHTDEWSVIIHILTGMKEYKSDYDRKMDEFLRRMMD